MSSTVRMRRYVELVSMVLRGDRWVRASASADVASVFVSSSAQIVQTPAGSEVRWRDKNALRARECATCAAGAPCPQFLTLSAAEVLTVFHEATSYEPKDSA